MKNQKLLKKVTHILDEQTKTYLPVCDKIKIVKSLSKKSSAIQFKKNRTEKIKTLRSYNRKQKKVAPIPGGVGFGVYYKKPYQWAFTDFSCIDFGLLTPPIVGGNSSSYVYLTATNGTAKGVEALISYYQQDSPEFKIFDWAKPESQRWSLSIPCTQIPENFSTVVVNGINHTFCRILNKTEKVTNNIWENKVCLFNFQGTNWDLIYSFQYESTLAEQKSSDLGSWGPIIETFQEQFTDLNPLGFYRSQLYNDKSKELLKPTNSTIRDDADGIDVAFREGNHTFYVI